MIPLIPVLALGTMVYGALKITKKTKTRKKLQKKLKKADARYQQLIRKHFDTLLSSTQRRQQIDDFSGEYTEKEAKLNRNLGLSVVNTAVAVLGTLSYPPLLIANGLLLVYMVSPIIQRNFQTFLQEKRIKFRLFASISLLLNYLAGFYIIGSLILVVVFTAFKLAARTEAYSRKSLLNTFALQTPDLVWVLVNGTELEIPFAQLKIGDVLVLNAGQTIPVDGVIMEGRALIDQHKLTGEFQTVEKTKGDNVLASTLLLTGKIKLQVERTGSNTVAMQIGQLLNDAADYHSTVEARSEDIADKTVFPTLFASSLALMTANPVGAMAIINSDLGSNVIFSGPLNTLSYLNIVSQKGILVKDGRSLEFMQRIDTVVFDKTGTLTLEQPEIGSIHSCESWGEAEILRYAAMAEHRQTHPIAKAILNAAKQRELIYEVPDNADYEIGFGIRVTCKEGVVQVGSARFIQQDHIDIPAHILEKQQHCQKEGHSLVLVALNNQLIGALELQAQLRPETLSIIQQLHARGLKSYILSGDHYAPTSHLASKLGIDDFFAEVLPKGKAEVIKQLQEQGRKVCFVGDGINDAIALQQADVSVSLRGATTVATDSAQVVLASQSLEQLVELFDMSKEFHTNQNRTLLYAFVPGGVLIVGVFLFHLSMPAALLTYTTGLFASLGNALYPLLKFNREQAQNNKEQ